MSCGRVLPWSHGLADHVILLAPTRQGLQLMLNICETYAGSQTMLFSTDKDPLRSNTKCMLFSTTRSAKEVKPVCLNEDELPWVDSAKYLGNY